jgi:hypothetical protein
MSNSPLTFSQISHYQARVLMTEVDHGLGVAKDLTQSIFSYIRKPPRRNATDDFGVYQAFASARPLLEVGYRAGKSQCWIGYSAVTSA